MSLKTDSLPRRVNPLESRAPFRFTSRQSGVSFKAFCLLVLVLFGLDLRAEEERIALTNADLFDGTQNSIVRNRTILLSERKIERIMSADQPVPAGYRTIDVAGYYLMPGLFDVHTHVGTIEQATRALHSGVTTVRSASVNAFQDVALRELVNRGALAGPDVVAAGVYVTPDLGQSILSDQRLASLYGGANSDEALRLLVAVNADRGVNVIKTRGTQRAGLPQTDPRQQVYSQRQLKLIVDEAKKYGLPVMVHAHGDEGARAAVLAGARSIEHGTYLSRETLELMKQSGTWFVPTYVTMNEMNEEQYDHVLRLRGKHMVPQLERAIRTALELGVKFATGADNYYDNESINRISIEVEHFVRLGMSEYQALRSATVESAKLLRLDATTGQVAEGYEADLIVVPANPLTNIEALQDVLIVVSNGQLVLNRLPFGLPDPPAE